jgi:hypothetical protein
VKTPEEKHAELNRLDERLQNLSSGELWVIAIVIVLAVALLCL